MRLVMGVSADGYVSRGPDDKMGWLGPDDKRVFRVLTGVDGLCAVSARTAELMPQLTGRDVVIVTREPSGKDEMKLEWLENLARPVWLLGGQTLALAAKALHLIDEVHLVVSGRRAFPVDAEVGADAQPFDRALLEGLDFQMRTQVGEVEVRVYR